MATQLVQQRFHLFPFLFRGRGLALGLFSLIIICGTVGFLGGHRASRFLAHLWRGRLFSDGLLGLGNTESGVPICQTRLSFIEGLY